MGIFDKRQSYKPFEYGEITTPFIEAMWASHWTHMEFSFKSDIQDFKTKISPKEREVVKRAVLLISQVEIAVKAYWSNIGKLLPKPEIADLGAVFGGVEVIHSRAYSEMLTVLGLEDEFEEMLKTEKAVINRVKYLTKYNEKLYKDDRKNILYSLILFTLFTEATSLFSQFYTILGFNRFNNVFKDMANIIQYTALEENCFIDGTEVLTPQGWVDLSKITQETSVYGFKEGVLKIEKPIRTVEKDFEGNLIKIGNNRHSKFVTPDHDVIVLKETEWKKQTAKDVELSEETYFPITVEYIGGKKYSMDNNEIDNLKNNPDNLDWIDLKTITKEWSEEFIKYLLEDGTIYFTESEKNVDLVQHIAVLSGYMTKKLTLNGSYSLHIGYKDEVKLKSDEYKKENIEYKGKVRCITVPSGGLVTRYNGDVFISGNCHMIGGIVLINTIVQENPELMDQKMVEKIYEEAKEAFMAESELIKWILQGYSNEFLSQDLLEKYVKYRLNECLVKININKPFKLREEDKNKFLWMEEQIQAPSITDFFFKKPIDYTKNDKPFDPDELFEDINIEEYDI